MQELDIFRKLTKTLDDEERSETHENVSIPQSDDSDIYFLARLRNRVVMQEYSVLINEGLESSAHINHLEDLIMFEGPKGLLKSIDILRKFANGEGYNNTSLKFDGSPAIVFGRDEQGQFILTDKSGFNSKGYDGKAKSAKELQHIFTNRKPVMDASREQFINNMMGIFNEYEKATPIDFRGFLKGDLMYYDTPVITNGTYTIKPNVVQYDINPDSKIGKRIGASKTGVVVHQYIGDQYKSTEDAAKQMQGNTVFVIPPVKVKEQVQIDTSEIEKLASFAKKYNKSFEELLNPNNLKGIADFPNMLYRYINNKVDTGLDDLGLDFEQWVNTTKLTNGKLQRVSNHVKKHQKTLNALWKVIVDIMKMKNFLVKEFDSQASNVKQSINGQPGGEGYVINYNGNLIKLVPRHTFSAANRAAH